MLGAIIGDVVGSYYEVLEINYYKKHKMPRLYEDRIKIIYKIFFINSSSHILQNIPYQQYP